MARPPPVTAVVVAYNGGQDLHACIQSLLHQTLPDLEILVVDNASTDGSIPVLESEFDGRIHIIRRETNGGYAAGANSGWVAATRPIVAILNQDVTFELDCLERMRQVLLDQKRDSLVTPKIVLKSDPNLVNAVGNDVHRSGVAWAHGLGTLAHDWHGVVEVTAISGAVFMTTRGFLDRLGGLEEQYFMYVEDIDLSLRARLAGGVCLAACDAVARHDWSLRLTPKKFGLLQRNWRALWTRFIGPSDGQWLIRAQAEAMGWVYATAQGRDHLKAKWWARRRPLLLDPVEPRPGEILPLLSATHPYHVVFPGSRALRLAGRVFDGLVSFVVNAMPNPRAT